jgi:antitoxin component YwqK of YwqJK toxin-antitoxin module
MIYLCCNSCKEEVTKPEPKIAKTVPHHSVAWADAAFQFQQDTLYYQQQFFTGIRYRLFANGDTEIVQRYFNGLEEGLQQKWYDSKQIEWKRFCINGKREGLQEGWWPDGSPKYIYTANNDLFEGELKEWNNAGLLYKQFHYVNGQEEGSQKMLWDNGTIRANYVVRNGKKYGLIGLKLCNNPYDSINKK